MKYGGYAGKILRVDLSSNRISTEKVSDEMAELYLGGNGFAAKILFDEVPAGTDPLGENNKLLFFTGPVTGTNMPVCGSRLVVVTKSPLNNRFLDSYAGGEFAAYMKYAGFDGIVIEGKAPEPVYLWIDDDTVEIRKADTLWGKKTYETQNELRKMAGDRDIATACIGPAGEKMARIACILTGVHAAGRGGVGAVMGSKNLKAIAVRGTKGVEVADPEAFRLFSREIRERISANAGTGTGLPTFGTAAVVEVNNKLGMLGTNNYQKEEFEHADLIGGKYLKENCFVANDACFGCSIACAKVNKAREGKYQNYLTVGPEYETLFSLGSNCGISSIDAIIAGDRLCDEFGIDTISGGSVISMAMECSEKGLLDPDSADGLDLSFGNHEAMVELVRKIGEREGIGWIMGEGTVRFAEHLGKGADKFAIHVKGLEVPAHSARGLPGMAIGYATSNRGGTHQDGRPTAERAGIVDPATTEGKGTYEVQVQRMTTFMDSMVMCRMLEGIFGPVGLTEDHARLVKVVTGMDLSIGNLKDIADRIYILERATNIREGENRFSDTLPWRFMNEPIPSGPSKGKYIPENVLNMMLDETYEERGWDKKTGLPLRETLERLKLVDLVQEIHGQK